MTQRRTRAVAVTALAGSLVAGAAAAALPANADKGRGERPAFTLTILHNNDGESSLLPREIEGVEYGGIARFISEVRAERRESGPRSFDRGESRLRGVVTLNSGDNFLAGLTREASNEAGIDYDALAVRQVGYDALSRSYGLPTAAGATLRPTAPARMMIVTR